MGQRGPRRRSRGDRLSRRSAGPILGMRRGQGEVIGAASSCGGEHTCGNGNVPGITKMLARAKCSSPVALETYSSAQETRKSGTNVVSVARRNSIYFFESSRIKTWASEIGRGVFTPPTLERDWTPASSTKAARSFYSESKSQRMARCPMCPSARQPLHDGEDLNVPFRMRHSSIRPNTAVTRPKKRLMLKVTEGYDARQ